MATILVSSATNNVEVNAGVENTPVSIVESVEKLTYPTTDLAKNKGLYDYVSDSAYCDNLVIIVHEAAAEFEIDPWILWSIMRFESHYYHWKDSNKSIPKGNGHHGVCQISPFWSNNKVVKSYFSSKGKTLEKFDLKYSVKDNVRCAAAIMKYALDDRGYDLEKAFGWFNTGDPVRNSYAKRAMKQYKAWTK
jgi:hypothetical protein